MPGMLNLLRKKAKPACSGKRSNKVVKRINRSDIDQLNKSMEGIFLQNRRESCSNHLPVFGNDSVKVYKKTKRNN